MRAPALILLAGLTAQAQSFGIVLGAARTPETMRTRYVVPHQGAFAGGLSYRLGPVDLTASVRAGSEVEVSDDGLPSGARLAWRYEAAGIAYVLGTRTHHLRLGAEYRTEGLKGYSEDEPTLRVNLSRVWGRVGYEYETRGDGVSTAFGLGYAFAKPTAYDATTAAGLLRSLAPSREHAAYITVRF